MAGGAGRGREAGEASEEEEEEEEEEEMTLWEGSCVACGRTRNLLQPYRCS